MMRLNTFMLAVCSAILFSMTAFFYVQSRQVMAGHAATLTESHTRIVRHHVETVLKGQVYLLSLYREQVSKGTKLPKAVVLSRVSGDERELRKQLEELRKETGVDYINVIPYGGHKAVLKGEEVATEVAARNRTGYFLADRNGTPFLMSRTPLRLFEEEVGILLLGFSTDRLVSEVKNAIGTAISVIDAKTSRPEDLALGLEGALPSAAYRVRILSAPTLQLNQVAVSRVLSVGAGSLLLVALLIYLVLHIGFVRSFTRNVKAIDAASADLDAGIITELPERRHLFREMTSLGTAVSKFTRSLKGFQEKTEKKTRTELLGQVAAQVAHDLNGVITGLEMTLDFDSRFDLTSEKKQAVRGMLDRMRGITSTVVEKMRRGAEKDAQEVRLSDEPLSTEVVGLLVDTVVAEKSAAHGRSPYLCITSIWATEEPSLCVRVQPNEFKRALANLVENAVQAVGPEGDVSVEVLRSGESVEIRVADNGCGISDQVLRRLGERGFSQGKANGSGLGIWHCRESLKQWNGAMTIDSEEKRGTTVVLKLPVAASPQWLADGLQLPPGSTVVLVDDERHIHVAWKARFDRLDIARHGISFRRYKRAQDFISDGLAAGAIALIDYELGGDSWNGLEVVEELGLRGRAVLVTGHYDSREIREKCLRLGVRLLPKPLVPYISISVGPSNSTKAVQQ